jgi:hypothetical protein
MPDMPTKISSVRMHVAVADRRKGFDAEEESAAETRRILIGDWRVAEHVKRGEGGIEQQEQEREREEEGRPAHNQCAVIEVLPERRRHAVLDDHAIVQAQFTAAARTAFFYGGFGVVEA